MFKSFFTILFVSQDKKKYVKRYKIYWWLLSFGIVTGGALLYFIGSMYYQVFFVNKNFSSLDKLNRELSERQNTIDHHFEKEVATYMELDHLKVMHNNLMSYVGSQTLRKKSAVDETKLLKIAQKEGILKAIEAGATYQDQDRDYQNFYQYLKKTHNPKQIIPGTWPIKGFIVGEFGSLTNQIAANDEPLRGILIGAKKNDNVSATADGVVFATGISEDFGGFVEIFHGLGFISRYYNLTDIKVQPGSTVKKGQFLAKLDTKPTANISYLYYQIISYGIPQNPLAYIF